MVGGIDLCVIQQAGGTCSGILNLATKLGNLKMKIKYVLALAILLFTLGCTEDGYRVEKGKVVYEKPWNEGYGTVIKELNADPETFITLGDDNISWAKDKNSVFWGATELSFIDSLSFEVLNIAFAKDKNVVVCGQYVLKEANPHEFKIRRIQRFFSYGEFYGVDESAAYLCDQFPTGYIRIASDSIEEFKSLDDGYYIDKEVVTWLGSKLNGVNVGKFEVLSGGYATDGNNVYYANNLIMNVDLSTFKVIDNDRAKDKNHRYFMSDKQ